jgi:hypothetical protein
MMRYVATVIIAIGLGTLSLLSAEVFKASAAVVFQADYSGPGGSEGGTTNIVTFGGGCTGLFSNANQAVQISGANPFTLTSSNYLNVHWNQNTGGIFSYLHT